MRTEVSSNPTVASVGNSVGAQGLAHALSQGATIITASVGSVGGTTGLTVTQPVPVSLAVTPSNITLAVGTIHQFTATENFTDGSTKDVTTLANWSSSNPSVAGIGTHGGAQGLVQALAQGTTTIVAMLDGLTGSTSLTVTQPKPSLTLSIFPSRAGVFVGKTVQFTAIGQFSDGSTADMTTSATWSSSNPTCASISNSPGTQGLASGLAAGSATITGVVTDANHQAVFGSASIVVGKPTLISTSIRPTNPGVQIGATVQLTAVGNLEDGSTVDLGDLVFWTSANPAIATVNNSDIGAKGQVTGRTLGTVTIVAVPAADVSPFVGSTVLAVTVEPTTSLSVRPAFVSIPLGDDQQFVVTQTLADGSSQDVTSSVTWTSSNPDVASIGAAGRLTSLTVGVTTITASNGTDSASTTLTVTPRTPGQARFGYVTNLRDSTISMYRVDGSTGLLAPMGTAAVGSGTGPVAIATDGSGKFIYTADRDGNAISAYVLDPQAGLLTQIPGQQVVASVPWALAGDPSGKFLFVASGPGNVSTFAIGPDGALTFVAETTAAPGGATSVAVHPGGTFVYTSNVNANTISAYLINPSTGMLTAIPGSPFSTGPNPESVTIDPTGQFLYSPNGNGQSVSAFLINLTTGALSALPGSPFPVGQIPTSVAVDPSGRFVFVSNQGDNNLAAFDMDSVTGALQVVPGSPFLDPLGFGPVQAIVDPLGKNLYVVNQTGNSVSVSAIDPTSGALTNLGPVPTGTTPLSITLVR